MSALFRILTFAAIAFLAASSSPDLNAAILGFQSDYAPGNWTSIPGTGSINTSSAPGSVSLTSGNLGSFSNTDFTISLTSAGTLSFDWSYVTTDTLGPNYDQFGYLLNAVFTQLSNNAGLNSQSGIISIPVSATNSFGFRQNTIDGLSGAATTTISNFSGPGAASSVVPEPASASLLVLGTLIGAFWQFRKRRQAAIVG